MKVVKLQAGSYELTVNKTEFTATKQGNVWVLYTSCGLELMACKTLTNCKEWAVELEAQWTAEQVELEQEIQDAQDLYQEQDKKGTMIKHYGGQSGYTSCEPLLGLIAFVLVIWFVLANTNIIDFGGDKLEYATNVCLSDYPSKTYDQCHVWAENKLLAESH